MRNNSNFNTVNMKYEGNNSYTAARDDDYVDGDDGDDDDG